MPVLDRAIQTPDPNNGSFLPVVGAANVFNHWAGRGPSPWQKDWARLRQPWVDGRGRVCVSITDIDGGYTKNDSKGGESRPLIRNYLAFDLLNKGYPLPLYILNAVTMSRDAWIHFDSRIVRAFRQQLTLTADLEGAVPYGGFDAMSKMTVEYQATSDPGEAVVDMDARTDARTDTPLQIIRSVPLPITHSDFYLSDRELRVSQSGNMPLDTFMGEASGRRVAESIEDQCIGNVTGVTFGTQTAGTGTHTGTSTVYGLTNFPQRLTKTNFTAPTAGGWTPETAYNEVLAAIQQLLVQYHRGPYMLFHSLDWTQYLNRQFSVAGGNNAGETLLTMIQKIPQISGVRLLERLTSTFTLLFVSLQSDVIQLINGMDVTTVAWDEKGGLEHRWKVMAIKVPRLFSDYNSRTGILHGTTA